MLSLLCCTLYQIHVTWLALQPLWLQTVCKHRFGHVASHLTTDLALLADTCSGLVYNATIKATPGVKINVTAHSKIASNPDLVSNTCHMVFAGPWSCLMMIPCGVFLLAPLNQSVVLWLLNWYLPMVEHEHASIGLQTQGCWSNPRYIKES
jgi:hypothetical protein